jgi:3-oxoacyl-[acyl-carrier protein] reductase
MLSRAGATVVAVYREDDDAAAKLALEPGWNTGRSATIKADLTDEAAVQRLAGHFGERHGALDILVNNVGAYRRVPFAELTEADWRLAIATNLTLPYLVTRHFLPYLGEGAAVINIGVGMALRGMPLHTHYTAAKAGLTGLTRTLSKELGPRGIRVSMVAPGMVETGEQGGVPAGLAEQLRMMTALRRFGKPAEIASAVLFLASDLGSYISGTTIYVDGGI